MNENEFIFPRDKMFKNIKYIIRAEIEKADCKESEVCVTSVAETVARGV